MQYLRARWTPSAPTGTTEFSHPLPTAKIPLRTDAEPPSTVRRYGRATNRSRAPGGPLPDQTRNVSSLAASPELPSILSLVIEAGRCADTHSLATRHTTARPTERPGAAVIWQCGIRAGVPVLEKNKVSRRPAVQRTEERRPLRGASRIHISSETCDPGPESFSAGLRRRCYDFIFGVPVCDAARRG